MSKTFSALVLAIGACALLPSPTQARPAECLLIVNGKSLIDGRCEFDSGPDGSFRMEGSAFIGNVMVTERGKGEGRWMPKPEVRSNFTDVGVVTKDGACWSSATASFCAWALGQRSKTNQSAQQAPARVAATPAPPPADPVEMEEVAPGIFRFWERLPQEWSLLKFTQDKAGKKILRCVAIKMTGSDVGLTIGIDKTSKTMNYGFSGSGTATIKGPVKMSFMFNNDQATAQTVDATNFVEPDTTEWLTASQPNDGPGIEDAFMNNRSVTFAYPLDGKRQTQSFQLAGSNAALRKLFECIDG